MTVIIPGMNLDHERVEIRPRNVSYLYVMRKDFYCILLPRSSSFQSCVLSNKLVHMV